MTDTTDLMMGSLHGPGINICGIAPRVRLSTLDWHPCWHCKALAVVRTFSGSGWYEDGFLCSNCGEDVASGYRPFEPRWRKRNIERALKALETGVTLDEFRERTAALIREEMEWPDEGPASQDVGP